MKFLATGTISLLLTSCYGTVQPMYGVPISFREAKIRTVATATGNPIPGLVVAYTSGGLADNVVTSTAGEVAFTVDTASTTIVTIDDTDGPANGGDFAGKTFELTSLDETVTMTLK